MTTRYKCWRSNTDKELQLICGEGAAAFEALPQRIKSLGPWTGSKDGDVAKLRLPYRVLLVEQGFVIVYAHVSKFEPEARPTLEPETADCPECKGSGHVPKHGGLKEKDCPRCGGRGWVRSQR